MLAEYALIGLSTGAHPLTLLGNTLPPARVPSDRLPALEHGARVEVAGLVVARQRPETAKGFVFVLLEDERGMVNAIVKPDVYARCRAPLRGEAFLWITGTLAKDDGTVNVLVEEVQGLQRGMRNGERGTEEPSSTSPLPRSAFDFLKSLRRVAPDSKDWG
jgi:error-prone DNA polymerase